MAEQFAAIDCFEYTTSIRCELIGQNVALTISRGREEFVVYMTREKADRLGHVLLAPPEARA